MGRPTRSKRKECGKQMTMEEQHGWGFGLRKVLGLDKVNKNLEGKGEERSREYRWHIMRD